MTAEDLDTTRHHAAGKGTGRPVLVGLDGSEYAVAAAEWAAMEAVRRAVPLRLVAVVDDGRGSGRLFGGGKSTPVWGRESGSVLEFLAGTDALLQAAHPGLSVQRDVSAGEPARELRNAARDCDLLVVGARGFGGFAGLALGSVSLRLAASAQGPLVVVPQGHAAAFHRGPTVVGIGPYDCPAVLRFAFAHAARTGGGLRAVHAWVPYPAYAAEYVSDTDILARQAAEKAAAWLKAADVAHYGLSPEIKVLRGRAWEVLVEQSATADLLVLGAHHRHVPLPGAIGQVLHHTLLHARCPVALVPTG